MVDVVSGTVRSRMMAGIKGSNTQAEMMIRKGLHRLGFRYQLHRKDLPGRPDMVFPRHRAVIFVNGCFWHAHSCHLFKWPSTRKDFWREKINSNRVRDKKNIAKCTEAGWKVLVVWECALKGKTKRKPEEVLHTIKNWLFYDSLNAEIEGFRC